MNILFEILEVLTKLKSGCIKVYLCPLWQKVNTERDGGTEDSPHPNRPIIKSRSLYFAYI